ncbi:DUF1642 domain-containing protein [Streptococcus hyointestinalis]|nr:DUF1642 domain-containing protein [Streptococcus hyointestinalis]
MNKLEAIEIIEQNKIQVSRIVERNSEEEVIQNKIKLVDYVPLDIVVNTIDKIGLKRVVVPKYIADKIEYCKYAEWYGVFHAMDYCFGYKDSAEWLEYNQETFARAWLDGYDIEKEKLYTAKLKLTDEYLAYDNDNVEYYFTDEEMASKFTEEEFKKMKFWDNPAFKVEEAH